jgi:hypothetical protein
MAPPAAKKRPFSGRNQPPGAPFSRVETASFIAPGVGI